MAINLVLRFPNNQNFQLPGTASIRSLLPPHFGQCQIRSVTSSCIPWGRWDFKFNSIATETTLTRYTADSYKLLTEWLESSPAQVLAALEGVSVVTIRNRLHSAREQGLLEKPGSGKRSAKKS